MVHVTARLHSGGRRIRKGADQKMATLGENTLFCCINLRVDLWGKMECDPHKKLRRRERNVKCGDGTSSVLPSETLRFPKRLKLSNKSLIRILCFNIPSWDLSTSFYRSSSRHVQHETCFYKYIPEPWVFGFGCPHLAGRRWVGAALFHNSWAS